MKVFPRNLVTRPLPHPQAGMPEWRSERGIALVVTLILLSVVTFLAVAFLFLTTRERGAVGNTIDMAVSRRAAEAATENARAQVLASIMSSNQFYYGMLVSTNFFNRNGFNPSPASPESVTSLTNVSYDYLTGGSTNFTTDQRNQNIANQYYAPRPPVFVRTNRDGRGDFRYYLDLNENGRFDTNGLLPELGNRGTPLFTLDTNGNRITITNFYIGDPEWVGVLERPDRPHSASNKFVARWCYIVVPSGKTLDVNALHNQAKFPAATTDGFLRNMGVGPWEMNLASFLVDLNTNVWNHNPATPGSLPTAYVNPTPYLYDITPRSISTGTAFEDSLGLLRYRYGGNWANLKSIQGLFGSTGGTAIENNGADDYSGGPLLLTNTTPVSDADYRRTTRPWSGAENLKHFFVPSDLLDRKKTAGAGQVAPNTFSDRLANAGYFGNSSYDRYTFYRLLSQMGTDSPVDSTLTNKIHLNYVNVDNGGHVVPDMQTNFVSWTDAAQFFTNAADRMLRATFANPKANLTNFGVDAVISMTNIPVLISNRFVYTPSLHRVLQVAANIWDATSSRYYGTATNAMPTIFSPIFKRSGNDVYIEGFEELKEVGNMWETYSARPLKDLITPTVVNNLNPRDRVLGVPLVIGAKKGFPNFNEFTVQSLSQVIRKVNLHRNSASERPSQTNQLFIVGISNAFGFEAWNSYQGAYGRAVDIYVSNFVDVTFRYTNDTQLDPKGGILTMPMNAGRALSLAANWPGTGPNRGQPVTRSFQIPLSTNYMLLSNSIYRMSTPTPRFEGLDLSVMNSLGSPNAPLKFETTGDFPVPELVLTISNRIVFAMVDHETRRIIDYVHLSGLASQRDLVYDDGDQGDPVYNAFWDRSRTRNILKCPPQGVIRQLVESKDESGSSPVVWNDYSVPVNDKEQAIANFRAFCGLSSTRRNPSPSALTVLDMQAPYTPVRRTTERLSWQVNDPLVHYTAGDLAPDPQDTDRFKILRWDQSAEMLGSLTNLNTKYKPWGGRPNSSALEDTSDPNAFSLELKDSGVWSSDAWDFPTNKFATLGLLGRVHRGTPWQTIYLKANDVDNTRWASWTGNTNGYDVTNSKPVMDRVLIDVFTTAIDKDATRGQLNVNQTGLAAWSALLGGVIGLTNTSSDAELQATPPTNFLSAFVIDPAGLDANGPTNSILGKIFAGVNRTRAAAPYNGSFKKLGDILSVPELTTSSPILNTNGTPTNPRLRLNKDINDAVYERLPQQLLGLMRGGDQPSFTIYAYGQALHPANRSIVTSGGFFGLCTNYQITAEFATRSVVRIQGAPEHPTAVLESFNVLPPE